MNGNRKRQAFTLVEILVATALTLVIMGATVALFGTVTQGVAGSRAIIETMDRLRMTSERLSLDLRGAMALPMLPPLRPDQGVGYFEYREGPGPAFSGMMGTPEDPYGTSDATVGDLDDVIMFTSRSTNEPFLGSGATQSQIAEIAWFMRGTTLYRRVLLVLPNATVPTQAAFYRDYDISVRQIGGSLDVEDGAPATATLVANTLGDLTKRENRFAHEPQTTAGGFPYSIAAWGQLGLPTLRECSATSWPLPLFGSTAPTVTVPASVTPNDYWNNPHPWGSVDKLTGDLSAHLGTRIAEDVILTNVLSFDVRAWDPGAPVKNGSSSGSVSVPGDADYASAGAVAGYGAYVNLGWNPSYSAASGAPPSHFFDVGFYTGSGSGSAAYSLPRVYDTWSTRYEHDGLDQNGANGADEGTNGVDDDTANGIDDLGEREAPPPYAYPLRGLQIKIRVFEPDSRQIREVTIVQDFLPE